MKLFFLLATVIFILGFGKLTAQNFTARPFIGSQTEVIASNKTNHDMPNWQEDWTKESVIAINKIIQKHGYPDESSPNRMYWILPGDVQRTITYTENLLFCLPIDANSCYSDNDAIVIKN